MQGLGRECYTQAGGSKDHLSDGCRVYRPVSRFSVGDYSDPFSIQSTSKPFTYALALNHMGAEVHTGIMGT